MKHIFLVVIFFATIQLYSQKQIIGKIYKAQISASCKEFNDGGGCMDYRYCTLQFKKKTVMISYQNESHCTPHNKDDNDNNLNDDLNKKYFWTVQNKIISIKGFNDYGKFIIKNKKLIGKKEMNYNEYVKLEFKQQ
ncbi:hypothetical protein [Flavobacterium sp.]|uniref:hypothetical protein n=1 Tax=Flavobacterium sp. TaxID=239 RepID=UPI00286A3141|nr:hypothetical protein [Flavobacterium sp.]